MKSIFKELQRTISEGDDLGVYKEININIPVNNTTQPATLAASAEQVFNEDEKS